MIVTTECICDLLQEVGEACASTQRGPVKAEVC